MAIEKDGKRAVTSQSALKRYLTDNATKEFFQHHCSKHGTCLVITRSSKLLERWWVTYYSGSEVEEDELKEMLDFIEQE